MTDCYCRGAGTCPDCDGHECAGQCTCNRDGAPQDTMTYGHVNATQTRLDAWAEKWRLTR